MLSDNTAFPWLILVAPGALFPLMALFVWLDVSRFKAYLPLLMAGKCISIISLVGWSIITRRGTIMEDLYGFIFYLKFILLSGDFFAMAVILAVIKSVQKTEDE